ncbi:MAG: FAD-dependent monooxygenase [Burkholderiaceae bacterium]
MGKRGDPVLIVGAGIGGLAAAIALTQRGIACRMIEQAAQPRVTGAGLQLAPNAVRILKALGLAKPLTQKAFAPSALRIRDLMTGRSIGCLPLGERCKAHYGDAYLTMHRADLAQALLDQAQALNIPIAWGEQLLSLTQDAHSTNVQTTHHQIQAPIVVGADGLWSRVRPSVPLASPPTPVGQEALRAVLMDRKRDPSIDQEVTVWVGAGRHVVGYPIQAGQAYSLVVVRHQSSAYPNDWDHRLSPQTIGDLCVSSNPLLRDLLQTADEWHGWPLSASVPVSAAEAFGSGRVALVGDAAHSLRPHMAQGAAMALEDAWRLADNLAWKDYQLDDPIESIRRYGEQRWRRVARVQRQSEKAGKVFQLRGPLGWARNLALRMAATPLLDQPWLYSVSGSNSREH